MRALNEEDDFNLPMTPMIDIVFQLLIFFLLATTIAEEERDIQINLPAGSQGDLHGPAAGTRLIVGVRKDGGASLGGQPIEWPELRKRLIDAARGQEKPQVFVRGDKEAPHGKVAQVYQICREAGIKNVNEEFRFEKQH